MCTFKRKERTGEREMERCIRVFTFWEPREKIPGYLRACMRTWNLIPNAEVVVLDFKSMRDWLTPAEFEQATCGRMTLAKQSDCYRAVLLEKYGGVWLDADTVITPGIADSGLFSGGVVPASEVVMFGHRHSRGRNGDVGVHGAFILAHRPHAGFLKAWAGEIPPRVAEFRRFSGNLLLRILKRKRWRICRRWDFCVNAIIDPLVARMPESQIGLLDSEQFGVFPETAVRRPGDDDRMAYRRYHFEPCAEGAEDALKASKGVIMLHNSWTPDEFMRMDEKEFLASGTRLARILWALL